MKLDHELEKRIQERVTVNEHNRVNLDVVLDNEEVISHVGLVEREVIICGCRAKVGSIGGVATRPEYREKGLATRLMRRAIQRIDVDGGDFMLVSGNRGLYRYIGCAPGAPAYTFRLTPADVENLDSADIQLVPYADNDLLKVVGIHQKEAVRFQRDLEEFRYQLLRWTPGPFWSKTETLMIEENGEALGYVATQVPRGEKSDKSEIRAISEYAGDRKAVTDSIKLLFLRYDMKEVLFFVPQNDVEFLYLLKKAGIQGEKNNLRGHTFKIINLPRFMGRFSKYIEERIGEKEANLLRFNQQGDKFSIIYKEERLELEDETLVALLFGTCDNAKAEMLAGLGRMAELLQAIFPIPFLYPGLNSV